MAKQQHYVAVSPVTGTAFAIKTARPVEYAIISHREASPGRDRGVDRLVSFHSNPRSVERALRSLAHGETLGTSTVRSERYVVEVAPA